MYWHNVDCTLFSKSSWYRVTIAISNSMPCWETSMRQDIFKTVSSFSCSWTSWYEILSRFQYPLHFAGQPSRCLPSAGSQPAWWHHWRCLGSVSPQSKLPLHGCDPSQHTSDWSSRHNQQGTQTTWNKTNVKDNLASFYKITPKPFNKNKIIQ